MVIIGRRRRMRDEDADIDTAAAAAAAGGGGGGLSVSGVRNADCDILLKRRVARPSPASYLSAADDAGKEYTRADTDWNFFNRVISKKN